MSAWVVERVSNPFLSIGNHCRLYWEGEKIYSASVISIGIQEKLHFFCELINSTKLHWAKSQFQIEFFGSKTVGWFGGSWLHSNLVSSISFFVSAYKTGARSGNQLVRYKKEHKDRETAIAHEWRKKRLVVLLYIWQSADFKVHKGGWSAFLLVKNKRVYRVF